jgi:hypothetical protein
MTGAEADNKERKNCEQRTTTSDRPRAGRFAADATPIRQQARRGSSARPTRRVRRRVLGSRLTVAVKQSLDIDCPAWPEACIAQRTAATRCHIRHGQS